MAQKPAWMTPHGKAWERRSERTAFENPWLAVREYDAVAPTGKPATYGPFGEALEAATAGFIKDALTVAMLLRLHHMAAKGELTGSLARFVLG